MLNYLWGFMIIIGIVYGVVTGNTGELTNGALDAAKEAVTLCITMLGVMSLWTGIMEIAGKSGLIDELTKKISFFINFLFPDIPKGHKAREYISLNVIANMLGLGWAATPAGLKAMEELAKLEEERGNPAYSDGADRQLSSLPAAGKQEGSSKIRNIAEGTVSGRTASNEMCTFLVINISSLQLIPVNIIAYRSQYGSINPAAVIIPGFIATVASTVAAVIFCRIMSKRNKGKY